MHGKRTANQSPKPLSGDEVTLCANTHNIADGTAATIKIVEKDADGADDVTTLKTTVRNNKIECAWKVVYTADDDDADSEQEKKENDGKILKEIFMNGITNTVMRKTFRSIVPKTGNQTKPPVNGREVEP